VAVDAALLFVIVMLIVQMWLLTATLESYLAGHVSVTFPAFLVSLCLFAASFAVYRMVIHLDRVPEPEEAPPPSASGP
jgi:hypothetical protein